MTIFVFLLLRVGFVNTGSVLPPTSRFTLQPDHVG